MLSSRLLISEARLLRPCAVKKLVGLSSAELTLLPVARSFWVVARSDAVDCRERRFWRTDAERTIPDMIRNPLLTVKTICASCAAGRDEQGKLSTSTKRKC